MQITVTNPISAIIVKSVNNSVEDFKNNDVNITTIISTKAQSAIVLKVLTLTDEKGVSFVTKVQSFLRLKIAIK